MQLTTPSLDWIGTGAVTSEDLPVAEDGLHLAATVLVGAVGLEDAEAILMRGK